MAIVYYAFGVRVALDHLSLRDVGDSGGLRGIHENDEHERQHEHTRKRTREHPECAGGRKPSHHQPEHKLDENSASKHSDPTEAR